MGTIVNRGDKHRAVVRLAGHKMQTKTFDTRKEAKDWVAATETALRAIPTAPDVRQLTVSEVLRKHVTDVIQKRPYPLDCSVQHRFARDFEGLRFSDLTHKWWIDTITGWKVKPPSARRYVVAIISAVTAAQDLKWEPAGSEGTGKNCISFNWPAYHEAMAAAERQGLSNMGRSRKRRISDEEVALLKSANANFNFAYPMNDLIDVALLTCMREAELCRITWRDLDLRRKMQMIRDRKDPRHKQGNDKEIPLLVPRGLYAGAPDPLAILKRQPKTDARIFPCDAYRVGRNFNLLAKFAKLSDIHFHDLRHEAITRLFEQGYSIDEVALVSGHKKWETLRDYVHITADSLHKGPRQMRAAA